MKSILTILSSILIGVNSQGQTTYIPDLVFENYLENGLLGASNGIPNDHYVMTAPLQNLQEIGFMSSSVSGISDLTGLEDFINVKSISFYGPFPALDTIDLNLYNLPLETVFVEDADVLEYISFGSTSLKSISIHYCASLKEIVFGPNNLSDSTMFHIVYCDSLKNIDFSELTFGIETDVMIVGNYQLEHLTFGQVSDTNIVKYGIHLMQDLHCIKVSNPTYFENKLSLNNTWWPEGYNQPNLYGFSIDCENPLGVSNNDLVPLIKTEIGVFDLLGRKVQKDQQGIVLIYFNDGSFIRTFNP